MHISARVDYAVRALVTLAAENRQVSGEELAELQNLPRKYLENILSELRRHGLINSQRGAIGGYRLGRPADDITIADVVRAVDGPLAEVRGLRPEATEYTGAAAELQSVWVAVRAALRSVLESVTLADVARGKLPKSVAALANDPESWISR
jgi:Rrf2 family protein